MYFPETIWNCVRAVTTRDEPDTIHTCCFESLIVSTVLQEIQTETAQYKLIMRIRPFYFAPGSKGMNMLIDQGTKDIKKIYQSDTIL